MKREFLDWTILRLPIIIFSMTLLMGIVIVAGGHYYLDAMEQEFSRNQADFRSISSQYLQVDEEEALIRQYYPEFIELYKQGLVGKERRLDWVETLQAVSEVLQISSLRYEISSQARVPDALPIDTGSFHIYQSTMNVSMDMLHEVDLTRFLDRVDRSANGLYSVSSCSFSRKNRQIDVVSEQANVSADCNLNWYSIKPADGSEITL
ncbi:MAG: hypothetical protein U5P41_00785 [Gammaproteobacteria bacterium]|nr:hypothetical protein [Gammaproteobacteria bacterium]